MLEGKSFTAPRERNPVWEAAMLGDVAACKLAKKTGNPLDEPDECGNSGLHHAVIHKHPTVVHYLLTSAAADPCRPNMLGNTPLHLAAGSGDAVSVEYLLAAKADPGAQNMRGETPLHMAAVMGFSAVLESIAEWALSQLEKPQRTPEWETFIKESTAELCVSESQIMKLVAEL